MVAGRFYESPLIWLADKLTHLNRDQGLCARRSADTMRRQHAQRNYNLTGLNVRAECVPEQSSSFNLTAMPRTDLWRSTSNEHDLKAPIVFTTLRFPFVSAEVTVSALWNLEWDQAGLVLFIGDPIAAQARTSPVTRGDLDTCSNLLDQPPTYAQTSLRWVKMGLELSRDQLHASSAVAGLHGTDWSSTSLDAPLSYSGSLRVKMERVGQALWLSYEDDMQPTQHEYSQEATASRGRWRKVRQITGFFVGVEDKAVRVGVYASRPAGLHASNALNVDKDLTVDFEDLIIF